MNIAISACGPELTANVEPRFASAPWFVFYALETGSWESKRQAKSQPGS